MKNSKDEPATDKLLFDLTVAIQPTRRAWVQAASLGLAERGISSSLATVVVVVYRLGKRAPQGAVAHEVGVNPAALVRTLDQGETAGLLKRCDAQTDRRAKEIALLPAGEAMARKIEKDVASLRRELLGDLPAQDVATAVRVLRHLESAAAARFKASKS